MGPPHLDSETLALTSRRLRGRWALPSQRRQSRPGSGSRGGGVAGSPGSRKVSGAPARPSAADWPGRRRPAGARPAGSAPPPAPRCSGSRLPGSGLPRLPGSRAPGLSRLPGSRATRPAPPGQSRAQPPQLLPPDRHRAEAGRGGAGAHLLDQSTPPTATPPGRTRQGGPLIPGSRPLSPLWLRVWAGPHAPSLPPPIQARPHCPPNPGPQGPPRPSVRTPGFQR